LLTHVPPFLLTGLGLLVGSLIALPLSGGKWSLVRVPLATLALGVYGLFGFHFLLFIALRHAPPVQANLVNYLWPLGIVLMAPLFLSGMRLHGLHIAAAFLGFGGATLAILGGRGDALQGGFAWGYLPALASAFVWASYSLLTQRVPPFPSAAIGLFGLVSGVLSLLCHAALEPAVTLSTTDWGLVVAMGLGPLGAAFYLWDAALKQGDARQIGVLSFLTPLLSTLALLWVRSEMPSPSVVLAAAMIIGAAVLGSRVKI
jgi:drug/metabolite transporter (DMT)-like permease